MRNSNPPSPRDSSKEQLQLSAIEQFPLNQHIISDHKSTAHPFSPLGINQPQTNHTPHEEPTENSEQQFLFDEDEDLLELEADLELTKQGKLEQSAEQTLSQSNVCKDIEDPYDDLRPPSGKHRKRKNNRKIRTTITREKLAKMNEIFAEYCKNKEEGKTPKQNLKEIGVNLSLGYSTILHKFRQFRANKMVKGGALIASLQKKRKYKKSKMIEAIIEKALGSGPFYTAVQLSDYIHKTFNKKYSRSIISRHLGEMGYSYKNLKSSPIEKNKPAFKQTRRVYANIVYPLIQNPNYIILYVDELACNAVTFQRRRIHISPKQIFNEDPADYVSVFLAATSYGVVTHHVKRGFYDQQQFILALQECLRFLKQKFAKELERLPKIMVITDMNKIHIDQPSKPIKSMLHVYSAKRYYLPPSSPHFNPIESMFTNLKSKLFKKEIQGPIQLQLLIQKYAQDIKNQSVDVYFQDVEKCLKQVMGEETKCQNSGQYNRSQDTSK